MKRIGKLSGWATIVSVFYNFRENSDANLKDIATENHPQYNDVFQQDDCSLSCDI